MTISTQRMPGLGIAILFFLFSSTALSGMGSPETPAEAVPVVPAVPELDLRAITGIPADQALPPDQVRSTEWWPWSRSNGALTVKILPAQPAAAGHAPPVVTGIEHRGAQDWALTCPEVCTVKAGEAWAFWALVQRVPQELSGSKTTTPPAQGSIRLSVTTRDGSNKVLDWDASAVSARTTGTWELLQGWISVPPGCTQLQLRYTGNGAGAFKVSQGGICKVREPVDRSALPVLELHNPLSASESMVLDLPKAMLRIGTQGRSYEFDLSEVLGGYRSARVEPAQGQVPQSLIVEFSDTQGKAVRGTLAYAGPSILVRVEGTGSMAQTVNFPGTLMSRDGDSWALPINQGLLIPARDPYFSTHDLVLYGGHGLCMPFFSLGNNQHSLLVIAATPDDARVHFVPPDSTRGSGIALLWEPSRHEWAYARTALLLPLQGDYNAAAQGYRDFVKFTKNLITLQEKAQTVPQVKKMYGAVNLWWWKNGPWWTTDTHKGVMDIATELKNAGIDRVLWSHDQEGATVDALNKLGFLTGTYDIYQDVWGPDNPNTWVNREGWPHALVHLEDGSPMPGWVDKSDKGNFTGGVICSLPGLDIAKKRVPANLATHAYGARFIDTTTASPLRECWNPLHPQSRSDDRAAKMALLNLMKDTWHLVTGSETGTDMAVPYLHYFEGMMSLGPYRLEDSGYDLFSQKTASDDFRRFQTGPYYRIPLFELVYHDCVLNSWYWGDSSNRVPELWDERDMLNALYGTLPLWAVDQAIWKKNKPRFLQSYRNATPVALKTAESPMTSHRFLDAAHEHQETLFANGTRVVANFGQSPWADVTGGISGDTSGANKPLTIPARSFAAFFPDGTMLMSWQADR